MIRAVTTLLLAAVLAIGCATAPTPQGPAQAVYAAHGAYAAALTIAVKYRELPQCGTTAPPICSDPATVKRVQEADNQAYAALQAAQQAVRTPGYGKEALTTALATAQALTRAYSQITATLKVTP